MLTHTVGAGARGRVPALLALTLVVALAACGTDPASPRSPTAVDVTGSYVLTTIDGQPLPARAWPGVNDLVMFDTMTVQDGGTVFEAGGDSKLDSPGVLYLPWVSAYRWAFDASASRLLVIDPGTHSDTTTYAVGGRGETLTSIPRGNDPAWFYVRVR